MSLEKRIKNAKGYVQPYVTAFGTGMNSGPQFPYMLHATWGWSPERFDEIRDREIILDRIFGLYTLRIETAGGVQMGGGGYGAMMSLAEGNIQGIINPGSITEYIMSRVKGKDGIGDINNDSQTKLSKIDKLDLLEERLLKGDISEEMYKELKQKIDVE